MSTTTITRPVGKIGQNLETIGVSSTDFFMADQFRANPFWLPLADAVPGQIPPLPIRMDADGWPTENFRVRGVNSIPFEVPLKMTFTGQADLKVATSAKVFGEGRTSFYDPATNTSTIIIVPQNYSNQLLFTFTNTRRNPGDPVGTGLTDLHLMWAKDPHATTTRDSDFSPIGTVFNPWLATALGDRFDFIRAMDLFEINNIVEMEWEWAYRRRPTDFFQGRADGAITKTSPHRGAALEYVIALCNAAGVGAWFCLPDGATPDYMLKFAQACLYGTNGDLPYTGPIGSAMTPEVDHTAPDGWKIKLGNPRPVPAAGPEFAALAPTLELIMEWGNETWNFGSFSVAGRNAERIKNDPTGKPFSFDNPAPSRYDASVSIQYTDRPLVQRVMVTRAVQMSDIFRLVYGDDAMHTRVQPILGCQAGTTSDTESLEFCNGYWNNGYGNLVADPKPPSHYFTAIARGAYRLFKISETSPGNVDIRRSSRVADALANAPAGFVRDPAKTDVQNAIDAVYASGPTEIDYSWSVLIAESYGLKSIIYEGCLNHGDGSIIQEAFFCNAANADPRMRPLTTAHLQKAFDSGIDRFCAFNSGGGNWQTWRTSYDLNRARQLGIDDTSARMGNPHIGQEVVTEIADRDTPDTGQNRRIGQLIPLGRFNFDQAGHLRVSLLGKQTARGAGPTFGLEIDGERLAVGKLPYDGDDLVVQTMESAVALVPAGVHTVALRPIQPLYVGFNTKIKMAWLDPGPLGDSSTDTDDFTTITDNAAIETEANSAWTKTTTGPSLVRDVSRGGVRPPIGTGGSVSFRYNRSQALTSPAVLVEAQFDLKPDSGERSLSLTSADGKIVLRGGLNGKTGFFTIDQNGTQGVLRNFGIAGDGQSGTVRLGLSWNGPTIRVLANGFTLLDLGSQTPSAPGIIAGLGMKATPTSDPATSTLIRSFRAVNQAVGAPIIVGPTEPAGDAGNQSVPGVAWLVRQLRHAI